LKLPQQALYAAIKDRPCTSAVQCKTAGNLHHLAAEIKWHGSERTAHWEGQEFPGSNIKK